MLYHVHFALTCIHGFNTVRAKERINNKTNLLTENSLFATRCVELNLSLALFVILK